MEHIVFAEYCKYNKVKELIPDEFSIEMKFENGETIFIGTGYDGMIYTHEEELKDTDTEELVKQLQTNMDDYFERYKQKYGDLTKWNT